MPAAGAVEDASAMLAVERAAPRPFRTLPAKHSVGGGAQPLPPLRVGQPEGKLPLLSSAFGAAAEQHRDREPAAATEKGSSIDLAHGAVHNMESPEPALIAAKEAAPGGR